MKTLYLAILLEVRIGTPATARLGRRYTLRIPEDRESDGNKKRGALKLP
jgi:hypothetical protein